MDEIMTKARYPRQNVPARRRKKGVGGSRGSSGSNGSNGKGTSSFKDKILLQAGISIFILVLILGIRYINTPMTSSISDKIKNILMQNLDLKNLNLGFNGSLTDLVAGSNKSNDGKAEVTDDTAGLIDYSKYSDDGAKPVADNENNAQNANGNSDAAKNSTASAGGSEKSSFTIPASGLLTSPFGNRISPVTKAMEFHKGVDIGADKGAPIKATLAGEVLKSDTDATYGNYIKLTHAGGIETVYAHCSVLLVEKGQKVKQGDIIAKVGDTGEAMGAHLHFEIWKDGKAVNPLDYIKVPAK
jgi:murein DD-endopeptidase MepM/ murein hydrolase activator NlpD